VRRSLGIESGKQNELAAVYACLGLWFPLRMYASWYERYPIDKDYLPGYEALITLGLVYLIVGLFLVLLYSNTVVGRWLAGTVALVTPVLALLAELRPKSLSFIAGLIERLSPAHVGIVAFFFVVLMVLFGLKMIEEPEGSDEEAA
ncbi:MAG TPA: hypothetical protein VKM72_32015, partial [Thermoanaerobaculia bacterium]|nr:hypothetical protein [Thermoanaerobaculia bacterium]